MPYTPGTWADDDPSKPLSAARMTNIETGISAAQNDQAGDVTLASDTDVNGAGDIILKTGGVERARISATGTGTGLLGSQTASTVSLFGDSITDNIVATDGSTYTAYADFGYWTWANMRLGRRAHLLGVHGYRGYRTDQLISLASVSTADNANYAVVLAGTNDVLQNVALATIKTNLAAIWDVFLGAGVKVIAGTVPPCGTALSSGQLQTLYQLNNWIRRQAYTRRNFYVVDWATPMADPSTGQAASGMLTSGDNIHPSPHAAFLMGTRLYNFLATLMPAMDVNSESSIDPSNLISNGNMNGNVSGVASGWTFKNSGGGTPTAVASKVARTDDVPGEWQQGVSSDSTGVQFFYPITTGFSVGDQVYAQAEFETDAGVVWTSPTTQSALLRLGIAAMITPAFSTLYSVYDNNHITPNTLNASDRPASGVLRTPVLTIPPTCNRLQPNITFSAQGTVRIGRCGLYKVGTGPAY